MQVEQLHTTETAAAELQLTTGRVRQICRKHNIGRMLGRDRILTEEEIQRIKALPERQRKSEKSL